MKSLFEQLGGTCHWERDHRVDREAAEYSSIGINKIDSMLRQPNCPFVLFIGAKKLVKRKEFERFISEITAIKYEYTLLRNEKPCGIITQLHRFLFLIWGGKGEVFTTGRISARCRNRKPAGRINKGKKEKT